MFGLPILGSDYLGFKVVLLFSNAKKLGQAVWAVPTPAHDLYSSERTEFINACEGGDYPWRANFASTGENSCKTEPCIAE